MKFLPILCALALVAPAQDPTGTRDLVDPANAAHRFDTFLTLLHEADLTFNAKGNGPYTVLAPTNDAFAKVPKPTLEQWHGNKNELRRILNYHILQGVYSTHELLRRASIDTLAGVPLKFSASKGRAMVGNAHFVIANVKTKSGMLHGIDQVLVLPSSK